MQPHEALYHKRAKRHGVEGAGAKARMDRPKRARGGSIRDEFNAAVNDQPARPPIREPGPLPAVHNREAGADEPHEMAEPKKGWADGQPRKSGGRAKGFHPGGEKGKLHREIGVPAGEKIPAEKLAEAKRSRNPEIRRDAIRAATMKKWDHG